MRLWSLHPRLLDRAGLGAVWREGLLARAVLSGNTRGYRNHPQLDRFRGGTPNNPLGLIDAYLHGVVDEAVRRQYNYDRSKLGVRVDWTRDVTAGQMAFEFEHLQSKLARRAVPHGEVAVTAHPMFVVVPGPIESWERR